jgi:hypothetical protein
MKQTLLVLCGALAGGVLGYFAYFWILTQGYKALVLPGGLLGIGAGFAKNRSILVAVICGLAATALGLVAEWQFAHFKADPSLWYFLAHVHALPPITLLMILLGGGIGFWVPFRRIESGPTRAAKRPENLNEPPSRRPE